MTNDGGHDGQEDDPPDLCVCWRLITCPRAPHAIDAHQPAASELMAKLMTKSIDADGKERAVVQRPLRHLAHLGGDGGSRHGAHRREKNSPPCSEGYWRRCRSPSSPPWSRRWRGRCRA